MATELEAQGPGPQAPGKVQTSNFELRSAVRSADLVEVGEPFGQPRASSLEPQVASLAAFNSPLTVSRASESDRTEWDAFVSLAAGPKPQAASPKSHALGLGPRASGYHEWAWRSVIEHSFGHECVYLMARRAGRLEGVLPLVQIKSFLFGRTMTSLPFLNYGGVVADSDDVARALVDAAAEAAQARGCKHVELRHIGRRFLDLPCKQHKVTMRLPVQAGMWDRLDRKVRNQIRKAEKSELKAEQGGVELLDEFYTVFARNMRDLGTPVYARRFFEEVLRAFPTRARVVVVRLKGSAIACGFTYRTGAMVEVPWASSVREHNSLCPNHLLYWNVIETALAEGCDVLDFGRSTPNEGTYKFKEQWGAAPLPLHWEYCLLREGAPPDQSPKNPKFRMVIETWKRLPVSIANTLGPWIVRRIP